VTWANLNSIDLHDLLGIKSGDAISANTSEMLERVVAHNVAAAGHLRQAQALLQGVLDAQGVMARAANWPWRAAGARR
jgi:hypothetical protein